MMMMPNNILVKDGNASPVHVMIVLIMASTRILMSGVPNVTGVFMVRLAFIITPRSKFVKTLKRVQDVRLNTEW